MLYQQILYHISYFILYFKIYSTNSVKQYHNSIHISMFPILYYPLENHTVPPNDLRLTVKLVRSLSPTQWSWTGGEISTFSFTNQEGLDSVPTYPPPLGPNYLEMQVTKSDTVAYYHGSLSPV
jgi:hypothetical protein